MESEIKSIFDRLFYLLKQYINHIIYIKKIRLSLGEKHMYIITNTTSTGEYTPLKAKSLKKSKKIMLEMMADNIRSYRSDVAKLENMSDKKVVKWAKKHLEDFIFNDKESFISYDDETFNKIQIYDLKKL